MMGEMDTSDMTDEWDIASIIDSLTTSRGGTNLTRQQLKEETMKESFQQAAMKTVRHEQILKSKGRVTRFVRATSYSDKISHDFIMSQHFQNVYDDCKKECCYYFQLVFIFVSCWKFFSLRPTESYLSRYLYGEN